MAATYAFTPLLALLSLCSGVPYPDSSVSCSSNAINECDSSPCNAELNATCINLPGGFKCVCPDGLKGDGISSCNDGELCPDSSAVCSKHAECQFDLCKGFYCECMKGYVGDDINCKDINECETGEDNCDSKAQCTNIDGSYNCTCRDGFTGDGFFCSDINECETGEDNCDSNAQCTNIDGSYNCTCGDGYAGDGFECKEQTNSTDKPVEQTTTRPFSTTSGELSTTTHQGSSTTGKLETTTDQLSTTTHQSSSTTQHSNSTADSHTLSSDFISPGTKSTISSTAPGSKSTMTTKAYKPSNAVTATSTEWHQVTPQINLTNQPNLSEPAASIYQKAVRKTLEEEVRVAYSKYTVHNISCTSNSTATYTCVLVVSVSPISRYRRDVSAFPVHLNTTRFLHNLTVKIQTGLDDANITANATSILPPTLSFNQTQIGDDIFRSPITESTPLNKMTASASSTPENHSTADQTTHFTPTQAVTTLSWLSAQVSTTPRQNSPTTLETTTDQPTTTTHQNSSTTLETTTDQPTTTTHQNSSTTLETTTDQLTTTTHQGSSTTDTLETTTDQLTTTLHQNSSTADTLETTTDQPSSTTHQDSSTTDALETTTDQPFTTTHQNSSTTQHSNSTADSHTLSTDFTSPGTKSTNSSTAPGSKSTMTTKAYKPSGAFAALSLEWHQVTLQINLTTQPNLSDPVASIYKEAVREALEEEVRVAYSKYNVHNISCTSNSTATYTCVLVVNVPTNSRYRRDIPALPVKINAILLRQKIVRNLQTKLQRANLTVNATSILSPIITIDIKIISDVILRQFTTAGRPSHFTRAPATTPSCKGFDVNCVETVAGLAAGGFAVLAIAIVAFLIYWYRQRSHNKEMNSLLTSDSSDSSLTLKNVSPLEQEQMERISKLFPADFHLTFPKATVQSPQFPAPGSPESSMTSRAPVFVGAKAFHPHSNLVRGNTNPLYMVEEPSRDY